MQAAALLPDRTLPLPSWVSAERRRQLAGKRVSVRISPAVRTRLRTKERIPVADWNERYRVMPSADSFSGHWRREIAPHAAKVMDTWALPWVREVWFCGPDQASKTNAMLGCLAWSIDRDPGNIFYTMPSEAAAKKVWSEKLIPMLRLSKPLAGKLSSRADDTGLGMIRLTHGVSIYPAWANSATSTATFSAKYTFNDEVDKWEMVGAETDPIRRIRKRAKNFRYSHKHFFASTPAGKYIHKGTMDCQQVWVYAARCPDCDELVIMDDDHFVIPQGWGEQEIKRDPAAIEYRCNACDSHWSETRREAAFRWGDWLCVKGADIARPVDVGFHLSGFVTPDMKMSDIAITIITARSGDLAARRDLAHGVKAIDYKEELSDRKEDQILRLRDSRPAGQVPLEADAITLHVDTQDNGFWYEVRAWRYGLDLKSWLVKHGYVPSATPDDFTALDALLASEFPDENGEPHRIIAGIIDSGGHRTSEVYDWCRRTGVLAAKGASGRKTQPVTVSRIDRFPGNNKPIPGGLNLYILDTHFHKDLLANKLPTDPTDNGAWVLHSGYTGDQLKAIARDPGTKQAHNLEEYARQFCVEGRDERNLWQCPDGKANHLFDCAQMGLALAMYLGFPHAVSEKEEPPAPPPPAASPGHGRAMPSWYRR